MPASAGIQMQTEAFASASRPIQIEAEAQIRSGPYASASGSLNKHVKFSVDVSEAFLCFIQSQSKYFCSF
jgi:hypothetical protein